MTNTLKKLTWAHHQSAERRKFSKELISGNIEPSLYYKFLNCQYLVYEVLEQLVIIPPHLTAILRAPRILEDIEELGEIYGYDDIDHYPESVGKCINHMHNLAEADDNEGLLAHMYVRHFGELHGGQIIKAKTPGKGVMYEFEGDTKVMIEQFRTLLNDDMADEAKRCFDFASELFDELSKQME
jgi:heme oxygenase